MIKWLVYFTVSHLQTMVEWHVCQLTQWQVGPIKYEIIGIDGPSKVLDNYFEWAFLSPGNEYF